MPDPDDNIMGKRGHVDYAYNAQISVDSDKQIIVGQHVSGLANDYGEVAEALDELERTCETLPKKIRMGLSPLDENHTYGILEP